MSEWNETIQSMQAAEQAKRVAKLERRYDETIDERNALADALEAQAKEIAELKAALAADAEGMVLMPREPTEAMLEAVDCGGEKKNWLSGKAWIAGYCDMIAAHIRASKAGS